MTVATDLFGAVYTTLGGIRYHADPDCYALANGRASRTARARREGPPDLYEVTRRATISAQQFSYTACLRCVPAADANRVLPLVTFDYAHRPVPGTEWFDLTPLVCARCTELGVRWPSGSRPLRIAWPCMSAVVLGLVPRNGETPAMPTSEMTS